MRNILVNTKISILRRLSHLTLLIIVLNPISADEVLPLESEERQQLLEIDDVMSRLQHIQDAIEDVTAEEEQPDG